jgi:methionine-rich copper-binding protein CopC
VSSAQTLAFTSVPDTTAPALATSAPLAAATAVAVGSNITLTFSEPVRAGTGSFTVTNGSDDVRTINASDAAQLSISGNTVTLNPTADLRPGTGYSVSVSGTALADVAGNPFAGLTDTAPLRFVTAGTAPVVAPSLLITEVNSNAAGGDFFEILNVGTAAADLTGWKWDDDSASFTDAASAVFTPVSIPAGGRLIVVASTDAAAFRAAWGLSAAVPLVALGGPGLGNGDAVVLFNAAGRVAASINFRGGAVITATDGTVIAPSAASAGVTAALPSHAGLAFGGNAVSSAVWDGVSTTAPTYRAAVVGVAGAFAQPAVATSVGSPGL